METVSAWDILHIEPTSDERAIKRAYARLLKLNRPEDDAGAFQQLRDAYETALRYASYSPGQAAEPTAPGRLDKDPRETLEPPPEAAPEPGHDAYDSMEPVRALWQRFLAHADSATAAKLEAMRDDPALLSFAAREALELTAVQYAASAACADDVREALVEHFGWADDPGHVGRLDMASAAEALGRYRAAHSWYHLRRLGMTNKLVGLLMVDSVHARVFRIHTSSFVREMKELLAHIRWQHPDLLRYRLNPELFQSWERRVAGKKYFVQTAFHSAVAGLALFGVAYAMGIFDGLADSSSKWAAFVACHVLAFSLVAWFTFRPPRSLLASWRGFKEHHHAAWIHQRRYQDAWQFGWIVPFAICSLGLLIPEPHMATRFAVTAGEVLCAAAAVFAGSASLTRRQFALIALFAVVTADGMIFSGFDKVGFVPCLAFCTAAYTLGAQRGERLYARASIAVTTLQKMRIVWLGVAAGLFILPAQVAAVCMLLWCLAGLLVARFIAAPYVVWIGLASARYVFNEQVGELSAADPRLTFLGGALIVIALFVTANLWRSASQGIK